MGETTHKISLYCDDILFLSYPDTSLKALLTVIDGCGSFAGFKINWSKGKILNIYKHKITSQAAYYLGIITDNNLKNLHRLNYVPLMDLIEKNISRWNTLPLSVTGRTNVIKMHVLPRLMYLFQSIPMDIPKSFFSKYNKIVGKFLWNNKIARIKRMALTLPAEKGGLGLPEPQLYLSATQLRPLFHWFTGVDYVTCTQTERHILKIEDLSFVPYCFTYKNIKKVTP